MSNELFNEVMDSVTYESVEKLINEELHSESYRTACLSYLPKEFNNFKSKLRNMLENNLPEGADLKEIDDTVLYLSKEITNESEKTPFYLKSLFMSSYNRTLYKLSCKAIHYFIRISLHDVLIAKLQEEIERLKAEAE